MEYSGNEHLDWQSDVGAEEFADVESFLAETERIAENPMESSLSEETAQYPLIVMQGITDIERKYLEGLPDFLNDRAKGPNDVQLLVKLQDSMILMGYVPLGLHTFIALNTLKERKLYVMPDEQTLEPVDDAMLMQFICQDLRIGG